MFIKLLTKTEDGNEQFAFFEIWRFIMITDLADDEHNRAEFAYDMQDGVKRFVALSYDGEGLTALLNAARQNPASLVPEGDGLYVGIAGELTTRKNSC